MSDEELINALFGLYAFDTGSVDSGVHDEALRLECVKALRELPIEDHEIVPRLWLSRLARDKFLTEEALAHHYGIEDVFAFVRWLSDYMGMGRL